MWGKCHASAWRCRIFTPCLWCKQHLLSERRWVCSHAASLGVGRWVFGSKVGPLKRGMLRGSECCRGSAGRSQAPSGSRPARGLDSTTRQSARVRGGARRRSQALGPSRFARRKIAQRVRDACRGRPPWTIGRRVLTSPGATAHAAIDCAGHGPRSRTWNTAGNQVPVCKRSAVQMPTGHGMGMWSAPSAKAW